MEFLLHCQIEHVQALLDALQGIKWKKQQDAVMEVSEHGLVVFAEELNCLQAKLYFRKELFLSYSFTASVRQRLGISLSLLVECLAAFSSPLSAAPSSIHLRYPGREMELLLKMDGGHDISIDAEIRTTEPETAAVDFVLDDGQDPSEAPVICVLQTSALKEALEDLEWPGVVVEVSFCQQPPMLSFHAQGHGDLQIDFCYNPQSDLFKEFRCNRDIAFKYKYKYLRATTVNIPNALLKDNRGTKLSIDHFGLLKVQHIVSLRNAFGANNGPHGGGYANQSQPYPSQGFSSPQGRIVNTSYIEFFVAPQENEDEGGYDAEEGDV